MAKSTRYQTGSIEEGKTALGMCWYIRFTVDGKRPRYRIGLKSQYPTEAKAFRAAQHLRDLINSPTEEIRTKLRTFGDVIQRYKTEEMPARYSTAKSYRSYLKCHIGPKWKDVPLPQMRAEAVRKWIDELPLASKTRGHIRDLMRILFRFAMLWEWIPQGINVMTLFQVPNSTKRKKAPRSLKVAEFFELLMKIPREPYRTMVLTVACLGVTCSEIAGLRWRDINWLGGFLTITTAVVDGREDDTKTEARKKPIPLQPRLAELLMQHRKRSAFTSQDDWVFASPHTCGEKTYHVGRIQQYVISPAAVAAGLGEGIGWHTFRHSYKSWLNETGASAGDQRDLMRHSDIRTTMNIYGDTFQEALSPINEKVVSRILS